MAIRMQNGDVVLTAFEAGRAAYALREQAERRLKASWPATIDSIEFANGARILAEALSGLPAAYLRDEIAKAEAATKGEAR